MARSRGSENLGGVNPRITRRQLARGAAGAGAGALAWRFLGGSAVARPLSRRPLDPRAIPKFVTPLTIPPAMPGGVARGQGGGVVDSYRIGVRQFRQQVLPAEMGLRPTRVWSYGSADHPETFNYPAFTIEARWGQPARVEWINQLMRPDGRFRSHLLPVDQTLHWANPAGGEARRDSHGTDQGPYRGPVPIVTHLHGGHSHDHSDGFPEAWYLPAARNIPRRFARVGSHYARFRERAERAFGVNWRRGSATFQYANRQRPATLWFHDHTLGITRLNVYAGPAGFYLLRGGPGDAVEGTLPGPAPAVGDPPGAEYFEIPLAIQDRTFDEDGELFYPDSRTFFEELRPSQLRIPFTPERACRGRSDAAPIWNPEFFGNAMVVNGATWPQLEVQARRYRFRLLNGCNGRFLILRMSNGMPFWQIGNEGGFLPAPLELSQLLLGPAERADVIVDFGAVSPGSEIVLLNLGPDEPFGGGEPGADFEPADPATTGQVMRFRVGPARGPDPSTRPDLLRLPAAAPLGKVDRTRRVSVNEQESRTVRTRVDRHGNVVLDCDSGHRFGPVEGDLGTVGRGGRNRLLGWDEPVTEHPARGATEVWEIHNFTVDAHPIHIHEVSFEVVGREPFAGGPRPAESWEAGRKDTVIAYPAEITRVKAHFDRPGLFVWHCHLLEHEDNEMMRPYRVG
jgi:spore coat protein A, manganese oxidase